MSHPRTLMVSFAVFGACAAAAHANQPERIPNSVPYRVY